MSRSIFARVLAVVLVLNVLAVWLVAADCQPGQDYWKFKVEVENDDAGFTVSYHGHYKILNNTGLNAVYVLYCTATKPDVNINGAKFMKVPVKNVSVADHQAIPLIELLGQRNSISSVVDPMTVTSSCVKNVSATATTIEATDVLFVNGTANETNSVSLSLNSNATPLGNVEWLKFIGTFYDLEKVATEVYDEISENYQCNRGNMRSIADGDRKNIAWVSYDAESKSWRILGDVIYYNALLLDAGSWPSSEFRRPITDVDQLQLTLSNYDIVVDETELAPNNRSFDTWKILFGYTGERSNPENLPSFLRRKQLYRTDKLLNTNGDEDWKERAPARPDLVLRDLIAIQYPTYDRSYIATWFRNLAKSDPFITIDPTKCSDEETTFDCKSVVPVDDDNGNGAGNNKSNTGGASRGKVLAIVLGVVGGVLGIASIVGFVLWRRRQRENEKFLELKDDDAHGVRVPDVPQVTEVQA